MNENVASSFSFWKNVLEEKISARHLMKKKNKRNSRETRKRDDLLGVSRTFSATFDEQFTGFSISAVGNGFFWVDFIS